MPLGEVDELSSLFVDEDATEDVEILAEADADIWDLEEARDDTTLVSRSELHAAHAAMDASEATVPERSEPEPAPAKDDIFGDLFDTSEALDPAAPVHERQDTSVLFSLDDFTKTSGAATPSPGVSNTQSSGLIDIRAVADRTGNRRRPLTQSPFEDAPRPAVRAAQDGPSIAVPVIKRRSNVLPMVIGAVVLIGGGGFAAKFMMDQASTQKNTPAAVAAPTKAAEAPTKAAPAVAKAEDKAATQAPPKAAPVVAKVEDEAKAKAPEAGATKKEAKEAAPAKATKKDDAERQQRLQERREKAKARAEKNASKKEAEPKPKKEAEPKPKKEAEPKPKKEAEPKKEADAKPKKDVNALLAALNKNKGDEGKGGASGDTSNLPQRLSSSKLRSTLRKKRGAFASCYKKMADRPAGGITVNTSLVVAGSGKVKSVRITSGGGASAGVLRCISSALRSAKFPPFAAAQMPVNYPIVLR